MKLKFEGEKQINLDSRNIKKTMDISMVLNVIPEQEV